MHRDVPGLGEQAVGLPSRHVSGRGSPVGLQTGTSQCSGGAVEDVMLGWTKWGTWCLWSMDGWWSMWCLWSNGARGSWMDEVQCVVPGWTRWGTWHPDGHIGAHAFSLFSQVTLDGVREGSVRLEGACPGLDVFSVSS